MLQKGSGQEKDALVVDDEPDAPIESDHHTQYSAILPQGDNLPDARLKFGPHKGQLVSRLAKTADGVHYLIWLLENEYPAELKEVIAAHIKMHGDDGFKDTEIHHMLMSPGEIKKGISEFGQQLQIMGHSPEKFGDVLKHFPRLPKDERM
jgi:hypothetical protein